MIKIRIAALIFFIIAPLFGQTKIVISKYDGSVDSLNLSTIKSISFAIDTVADIPPVQRVAYYPLNGNADDSSGNGYNGSTTGTEPDSDRFGIDSSALRFNGVNSYVDIPYEFDYPEKTVAFWFRIDTTNTSTIDMYDCDNPHLTHGLTAVALQYNGEYSLLFRLSDVSYDTVLTNPQKWHFVAVVTSYKNYTLYLDGTMIKSGAIGTYITSVDGLRSTVLGASRNLNTYFFSGVLDELRVFNYALMPGQVQSLYNQN